MKHALFNDLQLALWASSLAHEEDEFHINRLAALADWKVTIFGKTDLRFIMLEKDEKIFFAFAGTRIKNKLGYISVLKNLISSDSKLDGGLVHSEELDVARSLWHDVCDSINNLGTRELFLTGYSMGGALAALTGISLRHYKPDLKFKGIAFGSPRITKKVKMLDDFLFVSIYCDLIQSWPWLSRLEHPGQKIWISSDGKFHKKHPGKWKSFKFISRYFFHIPYGLYRGHRFEQYQRFIDIAHNFNRLG